MGPPPRADLAYALASSRATPIGWNDMYPWFAAPLLFLLAANALAADSGFAGRLIVGYQGWFGCPGDFRANREWQHWFDGPPDGRTLTVDMLPSVAAYEPQDLCDNGVKARDGRTLKLFSSQNPRIVMKHFEWMQAQGIDGAAFQRFVAHTREDEPRMRSDHVLDNVRKAAERHGRVFFVTYDISGTRPESAAADIRADWKHLTDQLAIPDSHAYLTRRGKPVVQLWGFGFHDRPGAPEEVMQLIHDLKTGRGGLRAAAVVGGVPAQWRTLTGDSKSDPAWAAVYRSFDVISPWTVGRFMTDAGADDFRHNVMEPDLAETRRLAIDYLPVVFPGFSWKNLMTVRAQPRRAIANQIPRRCGAFFSHQLANVVEAGAESAYAAMFDEVDEGTALFKLETRSDRAPPGWDIVGLDADGCDMADDWYLRLAGEGAQALHRSAARAAAAPTRRSR
jgi:hypothetical protein